MKELGLKERLVRYFQKNHTTTFIASGDLQRIVMANSKHTARSAVRRLQELTESKVLQCELRKGHAYYRLASPATQGTKEKQQTTMAHNPSTCKSCIANKEAVLNWK